MSFTTQGAKPAHLPIILTNRDSRLVKAAIAVNYAKDHADPDDPDSKALWRPLHNLWEREVKRACPNYRPLKGEFFGTICDSGREGEYTCGASCIKCQFLSSVYAPAPLQPATRQPHPPLPIVNMVPVRQHADKFAEIAAQPVVSVSAPEPDPTSDPELELTAQFNDLVESIPVYRQAIRQTHDEETILYYEDCIREAASDAAMLATKFPVPKMAELFQQLSALRL